MKFDLRQAHEHRLAVAHFELRLDAAADDLLGRDAIDLLRPRAHELDAAAGDDEGLEAVRPQVGEQFEHRLIDHLGVGPLGLGMLRGGDPILDDLLELLGGHARVRGHDDFEQRVLAAGQRAFHIALEQRGERLLVLPLRMLRREGLDAVEGEEHLEIHRLLGPERAVVVERGDALGAPARSPASLLSSPSRRSRRWTCLALPSFQDGSGSAARAMVAVKASDSQRVRRR